VVHPGRGGLDVGHCGIGQAISENVRRGADGEKRGVEVIKDEGVEELEGDIHGGRRKSVGNGKGGGLAKGREEAGMESQSRGIEVEQDVVVEAE